MQRYSISVQGFTSLCNKYGLTRVLAIAAQPFKPYHVHSDSEDEDDEDIMPFQGAITL